MPAIFFGHGNPMNALADNGYTRAWADIGRSVGKPRAILCISAHWYVPGVAVTAMESPRTIHDFGGFPKELFAVQYPAPGSPELAARVLDLLDGTAVADRSSWGLDHGTWSVLCHIHPDADVPVVQLSIDRDRPARFHHELGKKLAPLRDEDVLVIGSGNIVHNLGAYSWSDPEIEPFDWAMRFDQTARSLAANDHGPLIDYASLGPDALLSVPTPEHFLPLLYILALRRQDDEVSFPVSGFDGGSISMTAVRVG
ncbi:MAG: 4,5-DOPA dioxygenase extradiol [Acidobacteriota bacterium]|nr:MAG: 4,5-DOPA dioxygenase extradiol [Acidobacteriota bacterium]